MSSFEQRSCFSCGNPVDDQPCRYCTCERCGYYNRGVPCLGCNSEAENSFTYEPTPYSYNDSPNFSDYPPQPQYDTYFCELCGNDAHYGYDCPPQVPFVYDQDPCFNQNFDNNFPQTSPSFPQQFPCCENCGGPHENFQCQPMNQNFYEPNLCYNSISSGFDQFQPPQFPVIHQPPQETNTEMLQAREDLMEAIQAFLKKYDQIPPKEKSMALLLAEERFLKIKQALEEELNQPELLLKLINDLQILNGIPLKQEEQAAKVSSQYWKPPICYDDDDDYDYEKSTIPLNEIDSRIPLSNAITPVLPTLEPEDSLIIGGEHLCTIPKKESNEFIKSSVEDLVPIPSESEDTSGSDSECILPSCDDFSPINVYEEKYVTFSNPLFNSNDDFTSSDDESLSDEDVPEDNDKIYSNPLFKFDDEYISSDINPLFDEVLEDIECKVSYDSNLDESTFLVTPISDSNEDECFTPSDDVELLLHHDPSTPMISVVSILKEFIDEPPLEENDDLFELESKKNDWKKILYDDLIDDLIFDLGGDVDEIDAFLDIDILTNIKDGFYDSEGEVLYLESLLDTTPSLLPEVFLDRDPRSLRDINDLKIMVKVFDTGIHATSFSSTYVSLPFEDRHYLSFTYVIQIFLLYFTYPVESPFLLSSESEDIIFDPGISA
ncbi:hypothetical protein Tco_0594776 [Tanacetum coccineum]